MKLFYKTYDLFILGIIFLSFLLLITLDAINYFFYGKSFEGFMVLGSTFIFTLINLPILILLAFKKDYKPLKVIGNLVIVIFLIGFLGFKIPLMILPFITGYGLYFIVVSIKYRNINNPMNILDK